jgi:hypothetical protein
MPGMLIRPITPQDDKLLATRWAKLQPETQRLRFRDVYANVTLLAFTDDQRVLLGAAQYMRRPGDPTTPAAAGSSGSAPRRACPTTRTSPSSPPDAAIIAGCRPASG